MLELIFLLSKVVCIVGGSYMGLTLLITPVGKKRINVLGALMLVFVLAEFLLLIALPGALKNGLTVSVGRVAIEALSAAVIAYTAVKTGLLIRGFFKRNL